MDMLIGVGDTFTAKKEHWVVTDVRGDVFVCKNRDSGAVVEFNKETIKKYFK